MIQPIAHCPLCGGAKAPGTTTFTADLGSGVVVVRRVRAQVCAQCGEEWLDDAVALDLERMVNEARSRPKEIMVSTYPSALPAT